MDNSQRMSKQYSVFILLILVFNERLLYLYKFTNTIYIDVVIILISMFFMININKVIKNQNFDLIGAILFLFILIVISSMISYINLDQPFIYIMEANRQMIYYIMYFPIVCFLKNDKNYKFTENAIMILGLTFSLLAISQYYLSQSYIVLPGIDFASRFGEIRFYSGFTIVVQSFFVIYGRVFNFSSKAKQGGYVIALLIEFYYIVVVTKTRNITFILIAAIIVVLLIQKKYKKIYKVCTIMFILIIAYLFFYDFIIRLFESTLDDTSGTGSIRINMIQYAITRMKDSLFFGFGMFSPKFDLIPYEIHVDIGVFGFLFEFGIIGLIWMMLVLGKFASKAIKLYKINHTESYYFLIYLIYTIVIMPFNCAFNYKELIIYFIITYSMLEVKLKKLARVVNY